ncbi:hypothetical protein ACLKMH_02105 [Psychromonas sp. KJ10-10]|uniref:hypothetical protein n=1 Tax=Psychromonas sp. KJ10-10 TaxID=3391823 RepID=UPI0039B63DF0
MRKEPEETATVSFKIVDANGEAIEGEVVTFELLASPEGTSISVDTATSDEDGLVSTLIKSGVVAGPVVVKVVLVSDDDIYKTSNQLNISTGYPDQDSFTLADRNFIA